MDINFELYKIFYFVCKFNSITKTANFLYVSQPGITKHIKKLEDIIGKKLIYKVAHGIELTQEGKELYNSIKDSVESLINIENIGKNNNREIKVRIVAGYSTIKKFLLETLLDFNIKYPNIKFELGTYPYHEALQRLRDGKADLIFLNLKESRDNYNDIIINECYEVQDIFAIKYSSKSQYPDKIKFLDLNDYPVICKAGKSIARKNIETYFEKNNKKFLPKYELSNNWLIEEYVNMGMGIGLVTREFVEQDLEDKKMLEVKLDRSLPKRKIGYAYRKNTINADILKEFVSEIRKKVIKL